MSIQQKRLLSPDQAVSSPKMSKSSEQLLTANQFPQNLTPQHTKIAGISEQTVFCSKQDLLEAIKQSVADEFRKHDEETLKPIKDDIGLIKQEIKDLRCDREIDNERFLSLERQLKQRNIVFTNIPLSKDQNKVVIDTCRDLLRMREEIFIDKTITLKSNTDTGKMNLLVTFGSQKLADNVINNCRHLKDTGIGVARDLCQEDRHTRDNLLKIRKAIREKDSSQKIKVYGNEIVVNNVKLTYSNNFFGNKKLKIDGFTYFEETFGLNCRDYFVSKKEQ